MLNGRGPKQDELSFGLHRLIVGQRLLTRDGVPVELGARAFDILTVLTSTPNKVVSKKELLSQVWPNMVVEDGSLRFHIAGLRKALGDGKDGTRYITTIPGRGYCFVAPILSIGKSSRSTLDGAGIIPFANLPNRLNRVIGRNNDVRKLAEQLVASRFVTIVGPGGIGKTTVAVEVGHQVSEAFLGAVLFVDLGMLSDPKLVATALASMLGLTVHSEDALPSLLAYLRDKKILLIVDTCEHMVDVVAPLATSIIETAPNVHILATSREALSADGEQVYKLDALACPTDEFDHTSANVQTFPAMELFVERASASGVCLGISNSETAVIANICRRLDGVALAIELAAKRVQSFGLDYTAELLDKRLTLHWTGLRTSPPRQQTLKATLDWSYELLSDVERIVLRRLAVFVGHFSLDAALAVSTSAKVDEATVTTAIDGLVSKSMVATRPIGAMMRYRLLDTTRAYLLEIKIEADELACLAPRHAIYYLGWLTNSDNKWATISTGEERAADFAGLNNVRAALEWCLNKKGDLELGVRLAAAACPVLLAMSLLPECYRWAECGIRSLNDLTRGGAEEMQLQANFGVSSMHMYGQSISAREALNRSLEIAEACGNALNQIGVLGTLSMFHTRYGDFKTALDYANRARAIAGISGDTAELALAQSALGRALHFVGNLNAARKELEAASRRWSRVQRTYLGYDDSILVSLGLARTLWVQGFPTQAVERALCTIKDAERSANPATLGAALSWTPDIFVWDGDLGIAEEYADWLISHASSHSLGPYYQIARGYRGTLAIYRGDAESGVEVLRDCMNEIHAQGYLMRCTNLRIVLTQGLVAIGKVGDALTLIDYAISQIQENGDFFFMPEALRVKGVAHLSIPNSRYEEAEACFMRSLELSRSQGARAWELRAATNLANLWANEQQSDCARELLKSVVEQFSEGYDTVDVKTAANLLARLA